MSFKQNIGQWVVFLCVFLCGATAFAGPKVGAPTYTKNFGEQVSGEVVKETFILRNDGDAPLVIESHKTTCGCTVARIEEKTIAPGSETGIEVALDLKNKKGKQNASVILTTNDPNNKTVSFLLQGSAVVVVDIEPGRVLFGRVFEEEAQTRTFEVTSKEGKPFKVLEVKDSGNFFTSSYTANGANSQSYKFTVALKPPLKVGNHEGTLEIKTDSSRFPMLSVPVAAEAVGSITWVPDTMALLVRGDGAQTPITRNIILGIGEKANPESFTVESVKLEGAPEATFDVKPSGKGYRIRVGNLVPSTALGGKKLVIKTSSAKTPEIQIPVTVSKVDLPVPTTQPTATAKPAPATQPAGTAKQVAATPAPATQPAK